MKKECLKKAANPQVWERKERKIIWADQEWEAARAGQEEDTAAAVVPEAEWADMPAA